MLFWLAIFLMASLIVGFVINANTKREAHDRKLDRIQKELAKRGADEWSLRDKKLKSKEEE